MPWQQAAGGFAVAHRTLRPGVIEVVWTQAGRSLQVRGVIAAFQDDPTLRRLHRESLAAAAFPALFWETRPTDRLSADTTPFREGLVAAPALAPIQPDPTAFADHFTTTEQVAAFPSLGGDALLLAPLPPAQAPPPHAVIWPHSSGAAIPTTWTRVPDSGPPLGRTAERPPRLVEHLGAGCPLAPPPPGQPAQPSHSYTLPAHGLRGGPQSLTRLCQRDLEENPSHSIVELDE